MKILTFSQALAANLPATFSFALAAIAMTFLFLYSVLKKHKSGPVASKWDFLERRWVEIGFVTLGGGSAANAIFNFFGTGS